MDIKTGGSIATADELAALDGVLGAAAGATRSADDLHVVRQHGSVRSRRPQLLACLHAVNDRVGWISRGAVNEIGTRLGVAPAEVFSVASFYGLFAFAPRPARQVHVCVDLACRAAGGATAESLHGVSPSVHASPCLGVCERAPAALVVDTGPAVRQAVVAPVATDQLPLLADPLQWPSSEAPIEAVLSQTDRSAQVLLARIGGGDPLDLDRYRAGGGYGALTRALAMGGEWVINELTASGLTGRGGAAFPTGRKWAAVAGQRETVRHLVCNADESEPGTFKDRVILEGDPYALIEAMTIAAFATGCQHGWIYLRGEYPRARHHLAVALERARAAGLLGRSILGHELSSGGPFDFDIEIFRGAGAYICGEETAIFNSIEGFRGEPRSKPPFPVESGLFGKPTLVNNVETLVNVLPVVTGGGAAFARTGLGGSTGTKLFCVSGSVTRPGLVEVEFGATLGDVLEAAGGIRSGHQLQAVLLGGAAGSFVGPDQLDLALTLEATRAAGTTLGSGVVLVLDDSVSMPAMLERIAAFFRAESCGQCVPCRVGTVRQQEALARLIAEPNESDRLLLGEITQVLRDASICGLGQTAGSAIESAIQRLGVLR